MDPVTDAPATETFAPIPEVEDPAFADPTFKRISPPAYAPVNASTDANAGPPNVTPIPVKTIEQRAEQWQRKADEVVEAALLGVPEIIAGRQMNPFSTARVSILRRIGSEFVRGVRLADIADPFLAVGKFVLLMSCPLAHARQLAAVPEQLETEAYDLMDTIHVGQLEETVLAVNAFVKREMTVQVFGTTQQAADGAADDSPKN